MKCQIPQISWHCRDPVLSVDFQMGQNTLRRLATGGTDSHVLIWHVSLSSNSMISVECVCDLSRHNKSVNVVRFSPNGQILASGDDEGGIFLWKQKDRDQQLDQQEKIAEEDYKEDWVPVKLLRGHLDDVSDLCWSPDNNFILSGSIDNSAIIWDVQKGQKLHILNEYKGFVQGVSWDPLNQFLASLSSDRDLRIHSVNTKRTLNRIYRAVLGTSSESGNNKTRLFHDDTLQSFSRRLTFSPDGELLFAPSGIREMNDKFIHTTYVFSRYDFSKPVLHFPTGDKYTVAVRCCPVLFKLREPKDCKTENRRIPAPMLDLPYRVLIAVATQNSVFMYDTQQLTPFAYVSNIHYTHLTDISWSEDGRILITSSTDGYCSFIIFGENELGEKYQPKETVPVISENCVKMDVDSTIVKNEMQDVIVIEDKASKENITSNVPNDIGKSKDIKQKSSKKVTPKSKTKVNRNIKSVVPESIKSCSKTIESFFSPPRKLIKNTKRNDDDDDCVVILEKNATSKVESGASDIQCNSKIDAIFMKNLDIKEEGVLYLENIDKSENAKQNLLNEDVEVPKNKNSHITETVERVVDTVSLTLEISENVIDKDAEMHVALDCAVDSCTTLNKEEKDCVKSKSVIASDVNDNIKEQSDEKMEIDNCMDDEISVKSMISDKLGGTAIEQSKLCLPPSTLIDNAHQFPDEKMETELCISNVISRENVAANEKSDTSIVGQPASCSAKLSSKQKSLEKVEPGSSNLGNVKNENKPKKKVPFITLSSKCSSSC